MDVRLNARNAVVAFAALSAAFASLPLRRSGADVVVIVQGRSSLDAAAEVRRVGGRVTHQLDLVDGVGARLTPGQLALLRRSTSGLQVQEDGPISLAATSTDSALVSATAVPAVTEAARVHAAGVSGYGVTIAFVDSGYSCEDNLNRNDRGQNRILVGYDAIADKVTTWTADDASGHATHVMSTAVSSYGTSAAGDQVPAGSYSPGLRYHGVAPGADLVSVKAFDANGQGSYASVIRGIGWVVRNATTYDIRVLNLSFAAPPRSYYWQDPLNQAVMKAWQAGIVVVVSAGNAGPLPMTIGVPGNVPYVVTVGAMTDHFTPSLGGDDLLASFSSTGPTYEGFVKPELVAPGGHVMAVMENTSKIAMAHPEFFNGSYGSYFKMSGTSQAAAVVSGVAALVLSADPDLTPDQVKYRLMLSARPAVGSDGSLAYSVFQQGAGVVDAYDATFGNSTAAANQGLSVAKDLAGTQHFRGGANRDAQGRYYVSGYARDGSLPASSGFLWSNGYLWSNGFLWSSAFLWSNGFLWSNSWTAGYVWSAAKTESASINVWVAQE